MLAPAEDGGGVEGRVGKEVRRRWEGGLAVDSIKGWGSWVAFEVGDWSWREKIGGGEGCKEEGVRWGNRASTAAVGSATAAAALLFFFSILKLNREE